MATTGCPSQVCQLLTEIRTKPYKIVNCKPIYMQLKGKGAVLYSTSSDTALLAAQNTPYQCRACSFLIPSQFPGSIEPGCSFAHKTDQLTMTSLTSLYYCFYLFGMKWQWKWTCPRPHYGRFSKDSNPGLSDHWLHTLTTSAIEATINTVSRSHMCHHCANISLRCIYETREIVNTRFQYHIHVLQIE